MELNQLTAISSIDGRYRRTTAQLANYFSEYALIKYRIQVEVEYFIALCELPLVELKGIKKAQYKALRSIYLEFTVEDALAVKEIEKVTNHDVKAVEYYIKQQFDKLNIVTEKEFVHFGLTSQDINNTAVPLTIKDFINDVYVPMVNKLVKQLNVSANDWKAVAMLARTHGQPASPTKLGKEIKVYIERINNQLTLLNQVPHSAKFGGATGNFNAHHITYPKVNWEKFSNDFVKQKLSLDRLQYTTQIEHYDNMGARFHAIARINTILTDLCKDMWQYVSMEYFKQKIKAGEVGSSAMPHKVNPIDFENAEGNLSIANALLEYLAAKLPISRLQRDLTDSTVLRTIGVPLAHTVIAMQSITKGWDKLILNEAQLAHDLESNWAVVAEAIQTVLRREGYANPYEALKALTRSNSAITQATMHAFIDELEVTSALKKELKKISPHNYTGIF
ncbi:MAG: adenylosuccinate lyase [Bacteroidia bacterium]|nr:adenylosuccinate lyase [Bacteroidia bacterium]